MTSVVDMHRSPEITEEEVRRRLAACYSLLLDLAKKHKPDAPATDCQTQPDAPGDRSVANYQEPIRQLRQEGSDGLGHPGQ